jgi:hypothetical protein
MSAEPLDTATTRSASRSALLIMLETARERRSVPRSSDRETLVRSLKTRRTGTPASLRAKGDYVGMAKGGQHGPRALPAQISHEARETGQHTSGAQIEDPHPGRNPY